MLGDQSYQFDDKLSRYNLIFCQIFASAESELQDQQQCEFISWSLKNMSKSWMCSFFHGKSDLQKFKNIKYETDICKHKIKFLIPNVYEIWIVTNIFFSQQFVL